jgi:8-oxo-dGTP diphosphatase
MNETVRRGVGAVLVRGGRILLGLRGEGARSHHGTWDVIGGHCEPGESDDQTLVRELGEELGVIPTRYRSAGVFAFHEPGHGVVFEMQLFVVTAWQGTPENRSGEHDAIEWHAPAALPELALASPRYVEMLAPLVRG